VGEGLYQDLCNNNELIYEMATKHSERLTNTDIEMLPLNHLRAEDYLYNESIMTKTDYAEHCILLGFHLNVQAFHNII
jgi:hypothetical protein